MKKLRFVAPLAALITGLALVSVVQAAPGQSWTIDFAGLGAGATPTELSVGSGISGPGSLGAPVGVSTTSNVLHPAMIFDSDCDGAGCSGGDWDLGVHQGNVLIISEAPPTPGDPNDDANGREGGTPITVELDFSAIGTVCVASLDVVDIENGQNNLVTLSGPALAPVVIAEPSPGTGDITVQQIDLGYCGVNLIEWTPKGSGAIDNVEFSRGDRWMTGGGNISLEGRGRNATQISTHGFIIRCDGSHAQFQYNDHTNGGNFHLESVDSVVCIDQDLSPQPPATDFDTLTLTGTGRWNGVSGATVVVTMTDQGQPGTSDTFDIVVTTPGDGIVSDVDGLLTVGNHQAH